MEDIKVIVVDDNENIDSIELDNLLKGKDGKDGRDGIDGKDATINGMTTLNIVGGKNINIEQTDTTLKVVNTYEYDDTDVKNQINQVNELAEENERDISNLDNDIERIDNDVQDLESSLNHIADTKQDTLIAGENITIENNVISSTGGGGGDLSEYVKKQELQDIKYSYVKDGVVNNNIPLTDDEKLKIETWLGLSENYLTTYNETPYQVNTDYNPAHKKYVDSETQKLDDRISEIELFKFPNVTIFGTPTINNGQVSDFSRTDYLEFPFLVDFRQRNFEINFAFTTGTDIDNQQNILDSDFGLAFAIRNKHLVMALSFNGTSWATEQTGSLTLQPQISYRIKITWNGILYKVQYSIDGGINYIDDITFGSIQPPFPKQMYIGVGKLANNFFKGIINLNYANVKIQNELIWQGMDDVGLATRLATDLSNIDSAGEQKIKDIVDNVITGALGGSY